MEESAANPGSGTGKWGRRGWRRIAAATLVFSLAAVGMWYLHRHSRSTAPHDVKVETKVRTVLHLDPFVVNLADPQGDRFLRVGIELGLDREPGEQNHPDQGETPIARTRDTILMVLTTCNADGLMTPAGKAKLKDDLTAALLERAPELHVREIYFTEFLVQR